MLVLLVPHVWALRSLPELCYALLPPYCAMANTSFLPKVSKNSLNYLEKEDTYVETRRGERKN